MGTEEYAVGSIADLISGKNTPNKAKVIQKEFVIKKKVKNTPEGSPKKTNKKQAGVDNIRTLEEEFGIVPGKKGKSKKIKKHAKSELINESSLPVTFPEQPQFKKQKKRSLSAADNDTSLGKRARIDEHDDQEKTTYKQNAEKRVHNKQNAQQEAQAKDRTIFVGNVPINVRKDKLKKFFMKFGQVESVRLRGIPVADVRVPKKVAYIKKQFHPDRTSLYCYIR